MEDNLENEITVPDLAKKASLSPQGFRKVFKEVTGMTPLDYINAIRIKRAIEYMKDGNLTVSEIAEKIGIEDTNYFSRLFRKKTGYSPTEFKKQNG
jgi:AraC-like DNA-binding protein